VSSEAAIRATVACLAQAEESLTGHAAYQHALLSPEMHTNPSSHVRWQLLTGTAAAIAEQAGRERAASEAALAELQARLPGPEWKERHGAAGVGKHEKRGSPMVELSLILVRRLERVPTEQKWCHTAFMHGQVLDTAVRKF